ncbi:MAG: ATP-binding protein [Clostridia bacterium]|nr:ATP-binding protein [Clostridia bacterium]
MAEEFSNLNKAVWEYVTNGLQYVAPGRPPRIDVSIDTRRERIAIQDNGRGMDAADLDRFLMMHAPNEERLRGNLGRGRFGTGKAAAFGIGKILRVTAVRGGLLWEIEIRRADLEALDRNPQAVDAPVRSLREGVRTSRPDGVLIEIEGFRIQVRPRDVERLRRFMAARLRRFPAGSVRVNGRPCVPPVIDRIPRYDRHADAPPEVARLTGPAHLELHVAVGPLDADSRGVYAWISGQRLALGLCGNSDTPWAHRIFGDVDADDLDPDRHPDWPAPFSQGRREEINLDNPGAAALWNWVGWEIQKLIHELEEEERARRDIEEQRHLRAIAREIARVLNDDYQRDEDISLQRSRYTAGPDPNRLPNAVPGQVEALVLGGEELAAASDLPRSADGEGLSSGPPGPNDGREPSLERDDAGELSGHREVASPGAPRRQGGFAIEFRHLGEGDDRGRYEAASHAIVINLDHPEVRWARDMGGDVERTVFREIAVVEYAFALGQHQAEREGGPLAIESTRVLVDTRERVHRVTRRLPASRDSRNDEATP